MAVLGVVSLLTILQLITAGMNFLDGAARRKTDFVPTSFVQASVVDVVLPAREEVAESENRVPGYQGMVIVQYRDSSGAAHRKEFARINSMGPTDVYDKKVGDEFKIEVPDPENGRASTQEKRFWGNISRLFLGFAAILVIAALLFRFL
jgi:hypothetical protein